MPTDTRIEPTPAAAGRAVAFLFTDVAGSTALLRRLGARSYAEVIAAHDEILRQAVIGSGGHVVDTQGDAMFAAFRDAGNAVTAAVSAQRNIASHVWPEGEAIRVRMGAHSGVPEVSGGRYLGLDVHLAARICAAAHGGQIVASAAVAREFDESAGMPSLRSLGHHALKDFDSAQELFQVEWDPGAPSFPPLPTVAASDVDRFEGREVELASAAAAAIAKSARRSERRRVLAAVTVVAAIGALVSAYLLTQPTPIGVRGNSIAVLDAASGRVVADVPLASPPTALTASSGAIWVVSNHGGSLTRINETTLTTPQATPVKYDQRGPTDVGAGFGRIWVVNGFDRSITLVSTRGTAHPVRVSLPKSLGVLGIGDSHIAIGKTAIWIDNGGAAGVTRLTRALNHKPTQTPGLPTGAIAAGAGAVWVGGARNYFGGAGNVTELDPMTGQPVATFKVGEVDGLAAGLGHAWVTNATTGVVEPLDPVQAPTAGQPVGEPIANGTIGRQIRVGRGVQAIVADGSHLWTANPLTGVISEIDPAHGRVVWQRQITGTPVKLVASGGRLWVAVLPRPPAPQAGGVRIALGPGEIDSVDPAVSSSAVMSQIEYASGLNLVRFADLPGRAGVRIVPDAAAALPRVSNHGRRYTFRIRPGLQFSPPSGQKVTARTFQYTLERQITIDSTFGGFLRYGVVGASRFLAGKTQHVSGIHVLPGNTISITITRNRQLLNLLSLLALPYSGAVPLNWTGPGPNGSVPSAGAYYIRSYVPNDELILTRNPNYHGPRRGRIEEYTFVESRNPWLKVRNSHASYTPDGGPTPPQITAQILNYGPDSPAARAGDQRVFINPANYGALLYLLINTRTGPFTNAPVRQAMNEAIDRRALAATWGPSAATVTDQYLVPGIAGFPGNGAAYALNGPNPPAARRLMREAHITHPIHATLLTANDAAAHARAAIITKDLKHIGILLTTHTEPYAAVVQTGDNPTEYNLIDTNFQFAVPDPAFLLVGAATNWTEGPYAQPFTDANNLSYDQRAREFGRLDIALAHNFAPLAAYGYTTHIDYFAKGIRGQTFQPYFGIDYTRLYEPGH